jgi:hypothetical protein
MTAERARNQIGWGRGHQADQLETVPASHELSEQQSEFNDLHEQNRPYRLDPHCAERVLPAAVRRSTTVTRWR